MRVALSTGICRLLLRRRIDMDIEHWDAVSLPLGTASSNLAALVHLLLGLVFPGSFCFWLDTCL